MLDFLAAKLIQHKKNPAVTRFEIQRYKIFNSTFKIL